MARRLEILDLGQKDYSETYALQKQCVKQVRHGASDQLLFVEHPDVYTYGRKASFVPNLPNHLTIERGGEATFHNFGQLMGYPILSLKQKPDIHLYLRKLEHALISLLEEFGLDPIRKAGATGIWVREGQKKIASIGIAVSHWVSYHGFALNVNNDLSGFSKISPCGFSPQVMTSLKRELPSRHWEIKTVQVALIKHFCRVFEYEPVMTETSSFGTLGYLDAKETRKSSGRQTG